MEEDDCRPCYASEVCSLSLSLPLPLPLSLSPSTAAPRRQPAPASDVPESDALVPNKGRWGLGGRRGEAHQSQIVARPCSLTPRRLAGRYPPETHALTRTPPSQFDACEQGQGDVHEASSCACRQRVPEPARHASASRAAGGPWGPGRMRCDGAACLAALEWVVIRARRAVAVYRASVVRLRGPRRIQTQQRPVERRDSVRRGWAGHEREACGGGAGSRRDETSRNHAILAVEGPP